MSWPSLVSILRTSWASWEDWGDWEVWASPGASLIADALTVQRTVQVQVQVPRSPMRRRFRGEVRKEHVEAEGDVEDRR